MEIVVVNRYVALPLLSCGMSRRRSLRSCLYMQPICNPYQPSALLDFPCAWWSLKHTARLQYSHLFVLSSFQHKKGDHAYPSRLLSQYSHQSWAYSYFHPALNDKETITPTVDTIAKAW